MIRVQEIQKYLDLGELTLSGSWGGEYTDPGEPKVSRFIGAKVSGFRKVKRIQTYESQTYLEPDEPKVHIQLGITFLIVKLSQNIWIQ